MSDGSERDDVPDAGAGGDGGATGRLDAGEGRVAADDPGDERRARILLEYVTFGYGAHHLLKVVVFQFAVLFLDVGLLGFVHRRVTPDRRPFATAMWLVAAAVFLAILAALVRQMGRRTLAPRFHRPVHLAGSVCGYVVASGLSFGFGYATLVLPTKEVDALSAANLLPSLLVVLVFATFIAIGYHRQVDAADHPRAVDIADAVEGWLVALSWPAEEVNSLDRERAYEEFLRRTDRVAALLSAARTVEGRRLAADFAAWCEQFEAHATLTQERVVHGSDEGEPLESERLAAEQELLASLRRRLAVLAETTDG